MTQEPAADGPTGVGAIVVEGISPKFVDLLREMPGLLGADQPEAVRRRLYPDPCDDEEVAAEWRRSQHPELFALLASAREIVEGDLASLAPGAAAGTLTLVIPERHVNAWISVLQAVRTALGALHDVTAADMEGDTPLDLATERGRAIFRIEVLGRFQGEIVDLVSRQGEPGEGS